MTTFTFPVDPDPQSHPSAPELLSYSAGSATEAGIVWKSTSKWNASSYVIFRKLPGGNFTAIGKVNGTTLFYTDAGLNPDQEYIYAVQMTSVDGVLSDLSKEMSVKLVKDPDPANAPLPPTLLKAEALSDMEVKITWKLRRALAGLDTQQALEVVLGKLKETSSNVEFLVQMQKSIPTPAGGSSHGHENSIR